MCYSEMYHSSLQYVLLRKVDLWAVGLDLINAYVTYTYVADAFASIKCQVILSICIGCFWLLLLIDD